VDDPLPAPGFGTVPAIIGDMRRMAGGFTRVDLNEDRSGCDVRWTRPDIKHNTVPQLSTVTGLVYTYTQDTSVPEPVDAYYFEALDWDTGETAFRVLSGVGPYYYNGLLTSALGQDGSYYVALTGGIVRLKDGGDYWVNYDRMRRIPRFRRKAARPQGRKKQPRLQLCRNARGCSAGDRLHPGAPHHRPGPAGVEPELARG
jgi:hypothetical protein